MVVFTCWYSVPGYSPALPPSGCGPGAGLGFGAGLAGASPLAAASAAAFSFAAFSSSSFLRLASASIFVSELILNAANINFLTFSKYNGGMTGVMFSLFVIVLAAAEAAVALAIVINIFKTFKTVDVSRVDTMKE